MPSGGQNVKLLKKNHTLLHSPDREKLSHPQYNRDKCRGVTRSQYYHQPLVSGDQFPLENRTKQTYITASNITPAPVNTSQYWAGQCGGNLTHCIFLACNWQYDIWWNLKYPQMLPLCHY